MKKLLLIFLILPSSFIILHSQSGVISTIAGENTGNNVTGAAFGVNPYHAIPDNLGNVYIADASNHIIHKLNISTGILTVVAGTGSSGFSGDGGQATDAQLNYPVAVALDHNNNLYVVDESNYIVREINHSTGIIKTVAGIGGWWGHGGNGGPATATYLNNPVDIAFDAANNFYISDNGNNQIRKVNASTGIITVIAGTVDSAKYNGDNIRADSAYLNGPAGITLDNAGNIYFVDQNNCRIREIKASNDTIYTIAGGKAGFSGDGGPATKAQFWYPIGIAVDATGNVYVADTYENRIRKITIANDTINTICGNGWSTFAGDGGPASAAEIFQPHYLAFDNSGNLFVADMGNNRVREVLASNGTITTLCGDGMPGYNGNNIDALTTQLSNPSNIASDKSGNLYFSDNGNNMVREITLGGNILKIAGNGTGGFSGDGGPAGKAQLSGPCGIAINDTGNIFIADEYNERIREVNSVTNSIKTIAGNGTAGYSGDGSLATTAELFYPVDVAIDSKGDIYVADMINDKIREITTNGKIKSVAGTGYNSKNWGGGFSGDGGKAILAELYQPQSVALDNSNNLYIADTWNYRIRKVNLTTGNISTIAGNGSWGYSGDGGPATAAEISPPTCIRLDANGNIYIADFYNQRVREISVWDSTITTVAGTGTQNYSGDGGPAINADLDLPHGLGFDPWWNLYIADYGNNRIRMISSPQGLNNVTDNSGINVFPNPCDNEINVMLNNFNLEHASLSIIDITGRTVLQKDISNHYSAAPLAFNVTTLSPGIYFVNLKNDKRQVTKKIVKQ